jgi:hypothetical protein
MKKLFPIVLLLSIITLSSCSIEDTLEPQVDCKLEVEVLYSKLIFDEAVINGWDSTIMPFVNTTDIFAPGFLDVTYDPNMAILHAAMSEFDTKYKQALRDCK